MLECLLALWQSFEVAGTSWQCLKAIGTFSEIWVIRYRDENAG